MHVLVVGCGDLGVRLAQCLAADKTTVWGLRRNPESLPPIIKPVMMDLFDSSAALPDVAFDYVVYSVSAQSSDQAAYQQGYCEGLKRCLALIEGLSHQPRHLLFVSSSSVYGQHQGEWLDELSDCFPSHFTGKIMLEAEQIARSGAIPATVVRLAGLYDPNRPWLIRQVEQGAYVEAEPLTYANRIHRDDAAGLLAHLLRVHARTGSLESTYIGVDDAPVALFEVIEWLRAALGVTHKTAPLSRRAGSKRLSNGLAKQSGWQLQYPSYKEGYAEAIKSGAKRRFRY